MLSRRRFLGSTLGSASLAALWSHDAHAMLRELSNTPGPPEQLARDEDFWFAVQQAFTIDRSLINLNNGGISPSPAVVQNAFKRHWDYSNSTPPPISLWRVLEPQREGVRSGLAREWGVNAEELALTRNASESLETCLLGLPLSPGDEILTTTQDYPRMITTIQQRVRREGVVLRPFDVPVPCESEEEMVSLFERHITDRTRLILVSHVAFCSGQVFPVRRIIAMARAKQSPACPEGIPVIVDGAHAFAHLHFSLADLGCDYYGVSLHKWLTAPHGTGLLYVRTSRIPSLWPLMPAPEEMTANIRKYEEIGTHPAAPYLAIAEALTFHQGIGGARKEARLRFLRRRWTDALSDHPRIRMHTSTHPSFSCSIGVMQLQGHDSEALAGMLLEKHKILVTHIKMPQFEGIRVTPNVYTTLDELDRFVSVIRGIAG